MNLQAIPIVSGDRMSVSTILNSTGEERRTPELPSKSQKSLTRPEPIEIDTKRLTCTRYLPNLMEDRYERSFASRKSSNINPLASEWIETCHLAPIKLESTLERTALPSLFSESLRRSSLPSFPSPSWYQQEEWLPLQVVHVPVGQHTFMTSESQSTRQCCLLPPEEKRSPSPIQYNIRPQPASALSERPNVHQELMLPEAEVKPRLELSRRRQRLSIHEPRVPTTTIAIRPQTKPRQRSLSPLPSSCKPRKIRNSRRDGCNIPYTTEQVHRIRYMKQDRAVRYDTNTAVLNDAYPEVRRLTAQCSSSRFYRACIYPLVDEDFNLVRDADGKVKTVKVNVRSFNTEAYRDLPISLVEMHSRWAVEYSWVTEEDKNRARAILKGLDKEYYHSKTDKMRRAIELWEDENPKLMEDLRKLRETIKSTDKLDLTIASDTSVSCRSSLSLSPKSIPPHRIVKR